MTFLAFSSSASARSARQRSSAVCPGAPRGRAGGRARGLHSKRFVDTSPEETYATLLDEGTYLCSTRTMYRLLERPARRGARAPRPAHASRLRQAGATGRAAERAVVVGYLEAQGPGEVDLVLPL